MNKRLRRTFGNSRIFILIGSSLAIVLLFSSIFDVGKFINSSASANGGPVIGATLEDSFADLDMDMKAGPGEVVTYTATISNTGTTAATGVQFSDTLDAIATLVPGSFHASPVAVDDSYTAVGNTLLEVGVAASGFPAVSVGGGVLGNDGAVTDTISIVSNTNPAGGTLTINANGTFSYLPNVNFTGNDTFTYTVRNDAAPTLTDTATVTINVSNKVWYVNNSGANGNGRSNSPFNNLTSANTASGTGDIIFVHRTGTNYNTGISLKNNQQLIGQGVNLVVNAFTLVTATSNPVISPGGSNGINLASGNTIRGLTIGNTGGGIGISGSSVGTITVNSTTINGTGEAIDINGGALNVTLDSLSSTNSSSQGIDLNNVSGTFATGGTTITNSGSTGVDLTSSAGATFTFGDLDIDNSTSNQRGLFSSSGGTINSTSGTIDTGSGTAVDITGAALGIVLTSVSSSGGSSQGIDLEDTTGTFTVTGAGGLCDSTNQSCTGGTISNKSVDAITLDNTDGLISLSRMLIEDVGVATDTSDGINTRSGRDGIHGVMVDGGLRLDTVYIRKISDNCVNGSTFTSPPTVGAATVWNGLEILNSTIEDCNRFHLTNIGDGQDEGGIRIDGLTGTVTVDNSTFRRSFEHLDLFTRSSGTLTMNVTDSDFIDSYKDFSPDFGGTSIIGSFCLDVTVEGTSAANVMVGGTGTFPNNEFINCGTGSIRVTKDTVPSGSSNIDVIVDNNEFRVTDQTSSNGIFGNTPQGGVLLRAGPGGISTFDGIVRNNRFGRPVGPDDRIGSTEHEVANADGVGGNVVLIFESGTSQARVNNNAFYGSINAPWVNRAAGNSSAAVLYENNSYRGRDDYCCDGGFTFTVPGIPYRTNVQSSGFLDITFRNDQFAVHDQLFFAQTETLEFNSTTVGGGGTMDVCLDNVTSPDGFEFDEDAGTIRLYQGASNHPATGPCAAGSTADCQNELADDNVRGGPNGYAQSGTPNASLNPPYVDVDGNPISITGTACTLPSGPPFLAANVQQDGIERQEAAQRLAKSVKLIGSEQKPLNPDASESTAGLTSDNEAMESSVPDSNRAPVAPQSSSITQSLLDLVSSIGSMIVPRAFAAEEVLENGSSAAVIPVAGETVTTNTFTLPAGKSVTIMFQAMTPLFNGQPQMMTQGTVSGTNFAPVVTDDPATGAANDPTVTPLQLTPTAAGVTVSGRAISTSGRGLENVRVIISGGELAEPRYTQTNPFGYYRFVDLPAGNSYVITVSSKRYEFANPARLINVNDNIVVPVFIGQP